MMAILWDRMDYVRKVMNVEDIPLKNAAGALPLFDDGSRRNQTTTRNDRKPSVSKRLTNFVDNDLMGSSVRAFRTDHFERGRYDGFDLMIARQSRFFEQDAGTGSLNCCLVNQVRESTYVLCGPGSTIAVRII